MSLQLCVKQETSVNDGEACTKRVVTECARSKTSVQTITTSLKEFRTTSSKMTSMLMPAETRKTNDVVKMFSRNFEPDHRFQIDFMSIPERAARRHSANKNSRELARELHASAQISAESTVRAA